MLRRILTICFFFFCTSYSASTQAVSIDAYANQLFFNIYREKPDTAILGFLKLYVPSLYEKKKTPPGWTKYGSIDTTHAYQEMHAFLFSKHPYFHAKFAQGKLEIFCKRYDNDKLLQNITKVQLAFEFETSEDVETAFSILVEMFAVPATEKKYSTTHASQKAEFSDLKNPAGFNRVQFRMAADNLGRYPYKILFETGNDL